MLEEWKDVSDLLHDRGVNITAQIAKLEEDRIYEISNFVGKHVGHFNGFSLNPALDSKGYFFIGLVKNYTWKHIVV